jgi:hypothetical protein
MPATFCVMMVMVDDDGGMMGCLGLCEPGGKTMHLKVEFLLTCTCGGL